MEDEKRVVSYLMTDLLMDVGVDTEYLLVDALIVSCNEVLGVNKYI